MELLIVKSICKELLIVKGASLCVHILPGESAQVERDQGIPVDQLQSQKKLAKEQHGASFGR